MLSSQQQNDEVPYINMTPMVDVILCLLVFFMAATRLYDWDESEFAVRVPEVASAAPMTAAPDDLVLTVIRPARSPWVRQRTTWMGLQRSCRRQGGGTPTRES